MGVGSSTPAIRMVGVGKQYRRGVRREGYQTLRESVTAGVGALVRRARGRGVVEDAAPFWALKDVSLEVPRGAALGLIGPNGAGKSTLLKILSRVTEPTTGEVVLDGRVGSLLEVGTGFHPELTGRENVLLNGAILGMTRSEVLAKFDAIVAFAEVEPFIDTPVKHYSSGMYLRLAFAVAAHLEPEILLVDEVLAVGDAAFQKRCLGKMNEVARGGRTVVFVSHNLEAIQRLCSHAVMLDRGSVAAAGETPSVIARYLSTEYQRPGPRTRIDVSAVPRAGTGAARFASVTYAAGTPDGRPGPNESIEFVLEIDSNATRPVRSLAVFLTDPFGTKVVNADTLHVGRTVLLERARNVIRLRIRALHLMPGFYRVGLWLADPVHAQSVSGAFDYVESAFEIEVVRPATATGAGTGGLVTCDFDVEELR
jgi:ABC-type polysaccharide/polyol phosphate transport system ATPase subunit